MILVIGTPPRAGVARDGMHQRIAAIDALLGDEPRVYLEPTLDVSTGPFELETLDPLHAVARPSVHDSVQWAQVVHLALEARAVIVHSVYWAQLVLPLYALGHVVTDLHGVVPEEEAWRGAPEAAAFLGRVEREAVLHARAVLVVSDAMSGHLRAKYPELKTPLIRLPVAMAPRPPVRRPDAPPWRLIYAGHNSVWQHVGGMLAALQKTSAPWALQVLTPVPHQFNEVLAEAGLSDRVQARAVPPAAVPAALEHSHLAFVLREDHLVNRVACPTKLAEALACGCVPVVKSREIGDFAALGYQTVGVDDFVAGALPTRPQLEAMSAANQQVAAALVTVAEAGARELRAVLDSQRPTTRATTRQSELARPWVELVTGDSRHTANGPAVEARGGGGLHALLELERAQRRTLEAAVNRLTSQNRELNAERKSAFAALDRVETEANDLRVRLGVMERTRSWKATEPLRAAARVQRALKAAVRKKK